MSFPLVQWLPVPYGFASSSTPPSIWKPATCIALISFLLSIVIFCREIRNRHRRDTLFSSKYRYLSSLSWWCILMGCVNTFYCLFWYVDHICLVVRNSETLFRAIQYLLFEYFQLSRVYYCSSEEEVHSTKGYSKWVFIVMFSVTTLLAMLWFFVEDAGYPTNACGVSNGFAFSRNAWWPFLIESFNFDERVWMNFYWVRLIVMSILEPAIIGLYRYKIRAVTKHYSKEPNVGRQIQFLLHRMFTLSIFWIITMQWSTSIWIPVRVYIFERGSEWDVSAIQYSLWSLTLSYSMFLAQDYNTPEYLNFLRFLHRTKFSLCYCCWCGIVRDQYQFMTSTESDDVEKKLERKKSTFDTRNKSTFVEHGINKSGMELSITTATRTEYASRSDLENVDDVMSPLSQKKANDNLTL